MEILIVHHDAEMGEQLVQMVKDYTAHQCEFAGSDAAALEWGRHHPRCALLLTQLEAEGVDGLSLGGALSEIFTGLQTLFLPPYPASAQRLEITNTKVFPEPIDGEALLEAIGRAENAAVGAPDLFHFADILQMCCLSGRSGAIQMVMGARNGIAFLHGGSIVHAETTAGRGKEALFEIATWEYVEFAYDRTVRPPLETITVPWNDILIDAVERQKLHKLTQQRA
jgi:CheY-like chemotaxis protein